MGEGRRSSGDGGRRRGLSGEARATSFPLKHFAVLPFTCPYFSACTSELPSVSSLSSEERLRDMGAVVHMLAAGRASRAWHLLLCLQSPLSAGCPLPTPGFWFWHPSFCSSWSATSLKLIYKFQD